MTHHIEDGSKKIKRQELLPAHSAAFLTGMLFEDPVAEVRLGHVPVQRLLAVELDWVCHKVRWRRADGA